ncbi:MULTISPECIES: DUF4186 family protein [Streptosporangium]|uniref:DUF4186 domain-containing protein n=1 Tax=Streptosporangium brasiliense TaxID=47480 RepID=A0ABT9R6K6_9ACTN|nr:DUF4186 family protein [Streptosporangium brasiliense]MDP9864881.1 hypothetical protein [Streptosporangium brasiliense]
MWKRLDGKIKVRCLASACEDNLHCFKLGNKLATVLGAGTCRECKQPLVSMERVAQRDLADIDHTFAALQRECIRHYFWHIPFGQRALNYAHRAGRLALEERMPRRLRSRIGKAEPFRDGTQTPIATEKADALDYSMHAVAACCRKCVEYWHGIPVGQPLTEEEIAYLAELMRRYLQARLPDLDDQPRKIPSRPKADTVLRLPTARPHEAITLKHQHPHAS